MPLTTEELKAMQARLRKMQESQAMMRPSHTTRKRTTQNPRPQQTTQYRVRTTAERTLSVRNSYQEIAFRRWQNEVHATPRQRHTSSAYWTDKYAVPTINGRVLV